MARCSATGGSTPTLSVITPSFNSSSFLSDTLESVAALSTAHEHLVIDGGSSDGTVELLEHRHDPDLAWLSEPDRGQTHAVNKGLGRARGEFLSWLNADDLYIPENVDAAIGLLRSDPSIDAIFGHMDIIDANGTTTRRYRCGRFSWIRYLYFGEYIPTPTIIFRSSILSEALRLDESYVDAADYDFYLRLLRGRSASERESAAGPFSLPLEQQDRIQFCASGRRGSQDSPALRARRGRAVAHGGRVSGHARAWGLGLPVARALMTDSGRAPSLPERLVASTSRHRWAEAFNGLNFELMTVAGLFLVTATFGREFSKLELGFSWLHPTEVVIAVAATVAVIRLGPSAALSRIRATGALIPLVALWLTGAVAAIRGLQDWGFSQVLHDIGLVEYSVIVPLMALVVANRQQLLWLVNVLALGGLLALVVTGNRSGASPPTSG